MTATYVSEMHAGGSASAHAVSYPASIAAGNLLILEHMMSGDDYKTSDYTSAGFTEFGSLATASGSCVTRHFYKIATGSESGTFTVNTNSGSNRPFLMTMMRITGTFDASFASNFQKNDGASYAGSSTTIAAPDPGSVPTGSLVIASAAANGNANATATESAGYTEVSDDKRGAGGQHTMVVAYATTASPGACTFTFTAAQINRLATSYIVSEVSTPAPSFLLTCFP